MKANDNDQKMNNYDECDWSVDEMAGDDWLAGGDDWEEEPWAEPVEDPFTTYLTAEEL